MQYLIRQYQLLALLVLCVAASQSYGQRASRDKIKNSPLWVRIMNDPNPNYYVAERDYKAFWKGKEKPEEEELMMSSGTEKTKEHIKKLTRREMKEQRLLDYYRYQCKRFENWLLVNKPYVQADGHILTADERLQLWEQKQKGKQ